MAKSEPLDNKRHELFCQLYSGMGERQFMSNATLSYIEAYQIQTGTSKMLRKWKKGKPAYWDYAQEYKSARTMGYQLLTKVDIKLRVHSLFMSKFNPEGVDSELNKIIQQDSDMPTKLGGIREFNALKGRITKKIKLSGELKSNLSEDRLSEIAQHVIKRGKK